MDKEIKHPKDLGVKIGTKEEAEWTKILTAQETAILNSKINREIAEAVIKIAKKHIAEEEKI